MSQTRLPAAGPWEVATLILMMGFAGLILGCGVWIPLLVDFLRCQP